MIHEVTSSLPTYKAMRFRAGLNVVLATRHAGATDKDTRNSAGKTCLVEVIHFLLGAKAPPSSMFRLPPLVDHSFSMTFDLGGSPATVTRSGRREGTVSVVWSPPAPWNDRFRSLLPEREYSLSEWRDLLGQVVFQLPPGERSAYDPTFRMLVGYFARRERDGGFIEWKRNQEEMQPWQQHVAISYLLGFDWKVARRLKELHKYEEAIEQLRKGAAGPALGAVIGEAGELRSKLALAGERLRRLSRSLATFRVHEDYERYEREAVQLTRSIEDLSDADVSDRRWIEELNAALNEARPTREDDLRRLYEDAGVNLPGVALKRYEEVRRFHDSVIHNRRRHLERELAEAQRRVAGRAPEKQRLDERKAAVMELLQSHGALAQRDALQAEHARAAAEFEALKLRLQKSEEIAGKQAEAKRERLDVQEAWRHDVQDNARLVDRAVLTFERITSMLYEECGRLQVREDLGDKGKTLPFEVRRHGDEGKGVRNMLIFSFDMMLALFGATSGRSPGFIVHDSHVFDGADERQVGHALQAGASLAREQGFQYIVTMNSDAIPTTRPQGFDLEGYVNPVALTDEEGGGLFGVRFDRAAVVPSGPGEAA